MRGGRALARWPLVVAGQNVTAIATVVQNRVFNYERYTRHSCMTSRCCKVCAPVLRRYAPKAASGSNLLPCTEAF